MASVVLIMPCATWIARLLPLPRHWRFVVAVFWCSPLVDVLDVLAEFVHDEVVAPCTGLPSNVRTHHQPLCVFLMVVIEVLGRQPNSLGVVRHVYGMYFLFVLAFQMVLVLLVFQLASRLPPPHRLVAVAAVPTMP